jgi:hypothetical protein
MENKKMQQSATVIPFPNPVAKIKCCSCGFSFATNSSGFADQCSARFDPVEKMIVTFDGSAHGDSVFELTDDNPPSSESGPICDTCIDSLIGHNRLSDVSSCEAAPTSYEMTFMNPGQSSPGYAFLCYDREHWDAFIASMRRNFEAPGMQATSVPKEGEFPCLVICRGTTMPGLGPRMLDIDLLRKTLIVLDTG